MSKVTVISEKGKLVGTWIPPQQPPDPRGPVTRIMARPGQKLHEIEIKEAESFPSLNYVKNGSIIDLSFWRAPDRLFDEHDELIAWARAALSAAHRVAANKMQGARKGNS